IIDGALPEEFWICAAGHPNEDADPDGLRTLQKALAGAKVIITQAIHSVDEFARWMDGVNRQGALDMVHVIAEVIPITSASQLRAVGTVPGIRVPASLINELESQADRVERSAQAGHHPADWTRREMRRAGARITRTLLHRIRRVPGVSGFYLGCVVDFAAHEELLREAPLLPEHGDGVQKLVRLSGADRQRALAQGPGVEAIVQRHLRDMGRWQRGPVRRAVSRAVGSAWVRRLLALLEWPKVPIFGCKGCDRCDLSTDALVCPRGCAKQMSHGPCGAPRLVDGRMLCEDTTRECTWFAIRNRRRTLGVSFADRLEIRPAPSQGFYSGRRYSAAAAVLNGTAKPPAWRLGWRSVGALMMRPFRRDFAFEVHDCPRDLSTQVAATTGWMREALYRRPDMNASELLFKVLALVGTPSAHALMESALTELGVPASGALNDLSIREQFLLGEALPRMRKAVGTRGTTDAGEHKTARDEALLGAIKEGRQLRKAMRRELANTMILHIGALGVRVSYRDSVLATKQVDEFLAALTILKDELQMVRARLPLAGDSLSARFDRVHYRNHYRPPIAIRRFPGSGGDGGESIELLIDLRQFGSEARFRADLRETIERVMAGRDESEGAIVLEPFAGESKSLCWSFNAAFWNRLSDFEAAAGISYDESIGGSTDRNESYVRSTARAYFDRIHNHRLGETRVYVLEIGVASTHRARLFMDEFRRICELTECDYYGHTTYVLADYSDAILTAGTKELTADHPNVEAVRIDAANPLEGLSKYRGRVVHAHLCNVYDNLPTDKLALRDGTLHRTEARMYIGKETLDRLLEKHEFGPDDRATIIEKLIALRQTREKGVSDLLDFCGDVFQARGQPRHAYVPFWMDLFAAFRMEERYRALSVEHDELSDLLPGVDQPTDVLKKLLDGLPDVRVHLSQTAVTGFAQLLTVLHPAGTLEVVDLFVQRMEQYEQAFRGPAKYDGTTVNWINGPLMRAVAEQFGFEVRFTSFKPFQAKTASVIMLASRPQGD
ncbi:MAG: methylenetetrahydrofolate reductase C-terminal domain-containing protein, partial [Planctomycetes bacterium]|nr:methylenetetrahydrofolate reductase C-terminal domain-containing protein [Planctomycetota bacterium]